MAETPKPKWFITGGHTEHGYRNDRETAPLVCYGHDSLDALANSGITMWKEAEYLDAMRYMDDAHSRVWWLTPSDHDEYVIAHTIGKSFRC